MEEGIKPAIVIRHSILVILILAFCACDSNNPISIQYPDGGYNYSEKISSKDSNFYFYPLKDLLSTKDSFDYSYYSGHFYSSFDEPNLSLRPRQKSIFRLEYFDGSLSSMKPVVIVLTEDKIVVKEGNKGQAVPWPDTSKLNQLEKYHYELLQWRFPLDDTSYNPWQKKYLDSIANQHPKLRDPAYYRYLLDKSKALEEEFTYTTKKISISNKTYKYLVDQINQSGYWKMPFQFVCYNAPSDGGSFSLEANTPQKYNMVSTASCQDDTSKFTRACQELIKYAKMDNKIQLVWGDEADEEDTSNSIKKVDVKEVDLQDIKQ